MTIKQKDPASNSDKAQNDAGALSDAELDGVAGGVADAGDAGMSFVENGRETQQSLKEKNTHPSRGGIRMDDNW